MTTGEIITLSLGIANTLGTIGLAILGMSLNARQREDTRRLAKIDSLEDDLKSATRLVIDEQLGAIREQLKRHENRLDRGQDTDRQLHEADANLRVEVIREIAALREKVLTQTDLKRLLEELKNG